MISYDPVYHSLYTSSVTITASTTYSVASTPIVVKRSGYVDIQIEARGEAGATGSLLFNITGRGHPSLSWPTTASFPLSLTLNGTNSVILERQIGTFAWYDIRVLSIVNSDSAKNALGVNVFLSFKDWAVR